MCRRTRIKNYVNFRIMNIYINENNLIKIEKKN